VPAGYLRRIFRQITTNRPFEVTSHGLITTVSLNGAAKQPFFLDLYQLA
jgi:hypothetical protein